jgi:hypothetical protein
MNSTDLTSENPSETTPLGESPEPTSTPSTGTPSEARARMIIVASTLIALAFMMVAWNTKDSAIRNTNVGSRYATVEAIVNHGTFVIDDTQYNRTIDKVQIDGKFYSSKPPLMLVAAAGVYALERAVTGYDIRTHEKKVVWFVNIVFGAVLHVLMLVALLRALLVLLRREEAILVTVAAAGFASLATGYAVELNNHSVAAALTMMLFTEALLITKGGDTRARRYIVAGTLAGLLPGVDLPALAISGLIGLYLFAHDRQRTLRYFTIAFIPWILIQLMVNVIATGSVLPAYLQKGVYNYPGSYWNNPKGVDALDENKLLYAFQTTLGHHGVLSMTPLFFFAVVAIVQSIRERGALFREAVLVAAVGIVLQSYYILSTKNYGGNCVGLRWMIPYHSLLFVFVAVWLERTRLKWWGWATVLFFMCVGQFHVYDIFWTPWHVARWERWLSTIF